MPIPRSLLQGEQRLIPDIAPVDPRIARPDYFGVDVETVRQAANGRIRFIIEVKRIG